MFNHVGNWLINPNSSELIKVIFEGIPFLNHRLSLKSMKFIVRPEVDLRKPSLCQTCFLVLKSMCYVFENKLIYIKRGSKSSCFQN